jgi:hypothetical protein
MSPDAAIDWNSAKDFAMRFLMITHPWRNICCYWREPAVDDNSRGNKII